MAPENSPPKAYPAPSLRRLPLYLRFLKTLQSRQRPAVSCTHIAQALHLDPTQVRKDLALTGIVGRPRVGYEVDALVESVETFLGWRNATDAFLVGAGHLGTALLGYERFPELGLRIVAAFDADPAKAGTRIHGREVLPMRDLPDLAARLHLRMGILTVPARAAQDAADVLIGSGVLAIWNFTGTRLDVPEGIIVETEDLASSLAVLSARLHRRLSGD